jgi:hypothetical protein
VIFNPADRSRVAGLFVTPAALAGVLRRQVIPV